mmetsp:Transcript_1640/g.2877  ORF Transcript_1640/g.2877 Transcript_1640/m.2877 type:complete len:417 (-) Transcript_1640:213-1463(-)
MSSMSLFGEQVNDVLFIGFNQDNGCFACGTDNGFRIYNVDPFRETFRRVFSNGGIGIVEMLFRCNLLALVGGGRNPRYPTNKVMIWDDHQNRCIGELMFKSEVKAVKLRRDRVVVVLKTKVYVYRFSDLKLLDQITTMANPKGLVSLCPDSSHTVLACPGLARGSIRVELYDINKAMLIKAHDAELAQFALNVDGSRIASASEKGTLIRIWDCFTGDPLRELRRGMDRADIYCLCFNPSSSFVACSSDKGTVHIFSLDGATPTNTGGNSQPQSHSGASQHDTDALASPSSTAATTNNTKSGLSFVRDMLPQGLVPKYFGSEWSFAQVRGLEGKCICAFDRDSPKITVVSADGTFMTLSYEEGGECTRLSYAKFVKSEGEVDGSSTAVVGTEGGGDRVETYGVGDQKQKSSVFANDV